MSYRMLRMSETLLSLTDQVRLSARSMGAQITEAWAKRRHENHFISKLTDADAEQHETRHWIETPMMTDLNPRQTTSLNDYRDDQQI